MVYGQNRRALEKKKTFPDKNVDRLTCCRYLKTEALKNTLSGVGARYRFNHQKGCYQEDENRAPYTGLLSVFAPMKRVLALRSVVFFCAQSEKHLGDRRISRLNFGAN